MKIKIIRIIEIHGNIYASYRGAIIDKSFELQKNNLIINEQSFNLKDET
jgi:hypothetical protein